MADYNIYRRVLDKVIDNAFILQERMLTGYYKRKLNFVADFWDALNVLTSTDLHRELNLENKHIG